MLSSAIVNAWSVTELSDDAEVVSKPIDIDAPPETSELKYTIQP